MIVRLGELLSMTPAGDVQGGWSRQENRSLDIVACRYIFAPLSAEVPSVTQEGIGWAKDDLQLTLSSQRDGNQVQTVRFDTRPFEASDLQIVSSMSYSVDIPDGADVVQL